MNIFERSFFTPKNETHYLTEDTTIRQALEKFDHHKFSVVPIIRADGTYLTTVSEGDILRYIKNQAGFDIRQAENVPVVQIAKYRPYLPCRHDVSSDDVFRLAMEQNFIPIIDDRGSFIGIIKRRSILDLLYSGTGKEAKV